MRSLRVALEQRISAYISVYNNNNYNNNNNNNNFICSHIRLEQKISFVKLVSLLKRPTI